MTLPRAVIEAAKRAEELSKKLTEKTDEAAEEVVVADETEQNAEELALQEEVEESEEVEDETEDESDVLEAEGTESVVVEEEEEEEETETVQAKEETLEYWKNRFLTLQGKYNNEVPRLFERIRQLESQPAQLQKQESEEDVDVSEVVKLKPEDFEDYGDEFIALVNAVNQLEKRNKQLESLAQGFTTQSQESNLNTFKARMTEIVPDWQNINNSPDFITWLQELDGYSGMTRHQAMLKSFNQFDAETVGKIFNQYKEDSQIPVKKNKKPKQSIEAEVQPNSIKTEKVVNQPKAKGKIWKRSDIAKFYRRKSENKIDPKTAAKIEKDIFLANQEGRIR
jgi:hypothetical protein